MARAVNALARHVVPDPIDVIAYSTSSMKIFSSGTSPRDQN